MAASGSSDVFISYAREDKEFAQRLAASLKARGRECWADWEDIPLSADWLQEVKSGIEGTQTFVFVISPASINSGPCTQEIVHAAEHGKRIVPILRRSPADSDMPRMHPKLSAHNWVFFDKDEAFEKAITDLNGALDTDLEHVRDHTQLVVRAREWNDKGMNPSLLLRGVALTQAETWLKQAEGKTPEVTARQRQFIQTSRKATNAARRTWVAGTVITGTFAALALMAFIGFTRAEEQRQIADTNARAALAARTVAETERDRSIINAAEARSLSLASGSMVALQDGQTDLALSLAWIANRDFTSAESERALAEAAYAPGTRFVLGTANSETVLRTAALSPDGTLAASGDEDGVLTLWDMTTHEGVWQIEAHDGVLWQAAFSPEGDSVLSVGSDGWVMVWDTATGEESNSFGGSQGEVYAIALSPDGAVVASGGQDGSIVLWDMTTGAEIRRLDGHQDWVNALEFSPDGRLLLSGGADSALILWDVATGIKLRRFGGHVSTVNSAVFSPDGRRIASASNDFSVRLWDVATGQQIRQFGQGTVGHSDYVTDVAFTPDGARVLSGSYDNTMILWDANAGTKLWQFQGHSAQVAALDTAPDGRTAVTASFDGTLRVWDLESGAEMTRALFAPPESDSLSMTFSADGARILSVERDGSIAVFDATSGTQLDTLELDMPVREMAFNPDDGRLAYTSEDGDLLLYDGNTLLWTLTDEEYVLGPALDYRPDGAQIAVSGADNLVRLVDADTGTIEHLLDGHTDYAVLGLAYSPDGTKLVTTSDDWTAVLWDTATGAELVRLEGHQDSIQSASWSPDGQTILTAAWDNSLISWDAATGQPLHLFAGHNGAVIAARFTPDGAKIVSASADGTLRLWDMASGLELRRFAGHTAAVQSVAISADGSRILSAAYDGTIRLWHLHTLQQIGEWTAQNRYLRSLTCDELRIYNIRPFCDQTAAVVTVELADIYSQPGQDAPLVSQSYQGDLFGIVSQQSVDGIVWYEIEMPTGLRGWILGSQIQVDEPVQES